MTELIRSWVLGITGMSLVTSAVMALTPKGRVKKTVSLVCGLGMIVVLISPIMDFDYSSFAGYMTDYNFNLDGMGKKLDEENERLTRLIIQEETSAYILDKAKSAGAQNAKISVETKLDEDGAWYPWEVTVEGEFTIEQRVKIQSTIEGDLGIPAERQYWSTDDE